MDIQKELARRFSPQQIGELSKVSVEEDARIQCETVNAMPGNLTGYDCPKCKNKGYIQAWEDGRFICKMCDCSPKRAAMRRMERSGLADIITRYTFNAFDAAEPWQEEAKAICQAYADKKRGWLMISGNLGTGKTHLATAVCGKLIKDGVDVRYFMWRADSQKLKALAGTGDYEAEIAPYKTVKCLYIDDLFKGKTVSDADINLAFDLINARYNNVDLLTVISSEMTIEKILDIDQAIGSRIYERRFAYLDFSKQKNRRLAE